MDRQVTVSVKALVVAAAAALAIVAAYLVGQAGGGAAEAAEGDVTRTVTVQGVGHVSVLPDQLAFDLGVGLTREDLNTALEDSNSAMQAVIEALVAAGVPEEDVQTTDLSMYPQYSHRRGEQRTFQGYRVNHGVTVVVGDLTRGSDIVGAALAAGGTGVRLDGVRLQVGDPEAALEPARSDAVEQARVKAEAYAADTGHELGEVVRVSEVGDLPYDYDLGYAAADSAAVSEIPIQPGQADLTASVTVVFELE